MDPDTAEAGQTMVWPREGLSNKHITAFPPCLKELQAGKALACMGRSHSSERLSYPKACMYLPGPLSAHLAPRCMSPPQEQLTPYTQGASHPGSTGASHSPFAQRKPIGCRLCSLALPSRTRVDKEANSKTSL